MKKIHEWILVAIVGLVVVGMLGAVYYYFTKDIGDSAKSSNTGTKNTEVAEIEKDLKDVGALDLAELDSIDRELSSIDLSGL